MRYKRRVLLRDWMDGVAMAEMEARYKAIGFIATDAGSIRGIVKAARFHLRSVPALASRLPVTSNLDAEAFDRRVTRLEFGLPEETLGLLDMAVPLVWDELLALHARANASVG